LKRQKTGMSATLSQQEVRHETGGTAKRRIQPERCVQVFFGGLSGRFDKNIEIKNKKRTI
jgi:hypothetical protein